MEKTDYNIDIKDGVLIYEHAEGKTLYTGGKTPGIELVGECSFATHRDPDYPLLMFREELGGNINFLDDPVDCTPSGCVILGSGKTIQLDELPKRNRKLAMRLMHANTFQRTVPKEIKNRLMKVYSDRWSLYELLAYVPESIRLFDQVPALAMMLALYSEISPDLKDATWEDVRRLFSRGANGIGRRILFWLGIENTKSRHLIYEVLQKLEAFEVSARLLGDLVRIQNKPEFLTWIREQDLVVDEVVAMLANPTLIPFISTDLLDDLNWVSWWELERNLSSFSRYVAFLGWHENIQPLKSCNELERTLGAMEYQAKDWLLNIQNPIPAPEGNDSMHKIESWEEASEKYNVNNHWLPSEVYGLGWLVYYSSEKEAIFVVEREGIYSCAWKLSWTNMLPQNIPLERGEASEIWNSLIVGQTSNLSF